MTGEEVMELASEITDKVRHLTSVAHEYSEYLGTAVSPSVTKALTEAIEQVRGLEALVALIEERRERYFPKTKEEVGK